MKSWNVFSGDWSRMRYGMNQNLWESGAGRGSSGLSGRQAVKSFVPKKKNKKKFKNGIPEGLENDAQQMEMDLSEADMQENRESGFQDKKKAYGKKEKRRNHPAASGDQQRENPVQQSTQNTKKSLLEQQAVAMKAGSLIEERAEDGWQIKDPAALQEAIVWSEILGEPVSLKRRKRRVNQYYGD